MDKMSLPSGAGVVKVDNTMGALLIGVLLAMALWGVTCVQTYTFFLQKTKDSPLFKLMIAFLWCLDMFDSVLNAHFLYFYFVSNFFNPLVLARPVWSLIIHVANTATCDFIIRGMFSRRFYALSGGNIPLTLIMMTLSLADLIIGIIITAKAFRLPSYFEMHTLSHLFYLNFATTFASDVSITLGLSLLLFSSRTGFKRTDSLIKTLTMYVVNTGFLVVVDAALGMFIYIAMPNNLIFFAPYLLMNKLFLNCYLAMLNAREELRGRSEQPVSIHLSDISGVSSRNVSSHPVTSSAVGEKGHHGDVAITIQTRLEADGTSSSPSFVGVAC